MLGVVLMDFIRSGRKYLTKLGTTAQAVIKANPECLQPSEQLAPKVGSETGRGLDPVMHPCSGIMKSHRQPSLRTPSYLGLLCQTYWKFGGVPELVEFLHVGPQESVGRRMLCGSARPRRVVLFPLNSCVPLPCFPLPPSLVFYLSFSLALKTKVQRIHIPWLVSEMLHPASGHWSPLPILLGATAGKHPPMETVRTPEIFSKPVC